MNDSPEALADELDAIAAALIVEAGLELAEHEVYLDLASPGQGPFRALPGQTAGTGTRYVAEADVEVEIWDLLIRRDAESTSVQEVIVEVITTHS